MSFDREYFAFLLAKLAEDRALGLVGTPFREGETTYDYRFVSIETRIRRMPGLQTRVL